LKILQRRHYLMLFKLAAAAPYVASVICFIGSTVTLAHAAWLEEIPEDSDAGASEQPKDSTAVPPEHPFPALCAEVLLKKGPPLNP
jgi:hypothetical protein